MMKTESQIYGGEIVDILNPKKENVNIEHIAQALSKTCRFVGNTRTFYSVAEHCILTSDMMPPKYKLYGLLHDAHEAFIGDISTPVAHAIKALTGQDPIAILKDKWDEVIYPSFGLEVPNGVVNSEIKLADLDAYNYEIANLMWDCEHWRYYPNKGFKPYTQQKAYEKFMAKFTKIVEETQWI